MGQAKGFTTPLLASKGRVSTGCHLARAERQPTLDDPETLTKHVYDQLLSTENASYAD